MICQVQFMPSAIILFQFYLDFSEAAAFGSDMDIDVLEIEVYGYSGLVCFFFFTNGV